MLHQELTLYSTLDRFYIVSNGPVQEAVCISRLDDTPPALLPSFNPAELYSPEVKRIDGIYGSIQLVRSKYLIVITSKQHLGSILGKPIYQLMTCEIIPYQGSDHHLSESQKILNQDYLNLVTSFFHIPMFLFSYEYPLTRNLQSARESDGRTRTSFAYNWHLLNDFRRPGLERFVLPIVHGFFRSQKIFYNNNEIVLTLFSRRNSLRAGTRLFSRGIDQEGCTSNFVETEQILQIQNKIVSFVQIRGSIPLFWQQMPNLKYKPRPTLENVTDSEHESAYHKHILRIRTLLSKVDRTTVPILMISLINHTGAERLMYSKFDEIFTRTGEPYVHLQHFDFHHECRKGRWDKLSILMDKINRDIDNYGYYCEDSGSVTLLQTGLIRTNCIDSLDRTNVVQSLIAKTIFEQVLRSCNLLYFAQHLEDAHDIYYHFRNVWADNADACSCQYAGTPALKTDFTRTGKRNLHGMYRDGVNSVVRYFRNNFEDGIRQDSLDLMLGRYVVSPKEGNEIQSPIYKRNWLATSALPMVCCVLFALGFMCFFYPKNYSQMFYAFAFWLSLAASSITYLFSNGANFVDNPTLARQHVSVRYRNNH